MDNNKESKAELEKRFKSYCLWMINIDNNFNPVLFYFNQIEKIGRGGKFFAEEFNAKITVEELKHAVDELGGTLEVLNAVVTKEKDKYILKYKANNLIKRFGHIWLEAGALEIGESILVTVANDFSSDARKKYEHLKLKKLYYVEKTKEDEDSGTLIKYTVSKIVCICTKGGKQQEVELSARELITDHLSDTLKAFIFKELKSMYIHTGKVYDDSKRMNILDNISIVYKVKDLEEEKDIEFIEDNSHNVTEWANKLRVAGEQVEIDNYTLNKIITKRTEIRLPNVMYVNHMAFAESNIKKMIVTSPDTLIYQHVNAVGWEANNFRSKATEKIEIVYEDGASPLFSSANETKLQKIYMCGYIINDTLAPTTRLRNLGDQVI